MLKYAITPFLVPPGLFIVLLVGAAAMFFRRKHHVAGLVNLLIAALLWLSATGVASDALIRGLESPYEAPAKIRGDVIILLGGGVNDGAADLTGKGAPSEEMLGRVVTAVRLYMRLRVPVIVSGGKVFEHGGSEAPVVGRFLVDLGVPPEKVILEDRSRDTRENAVNTIILCRARGFTRPLLVTSAYHMRRASLVFGKAGEKVVPVPSDFRTWPGKKHHWEDFLPTVFSLKKTSIAIREYLGLAFTRVAY